MRGFVFLFLLLWCFAFVRSLSANDKGKSDDLSQWTLDEKIGQLFLIGFRSFEQLEKVKPAGVVLFSWSLKDVDSAKSLIQQINVKNQAIGKAPIFIATDHEGGRVVRLRKGLTHFPDALALGATEKKQTAFRVGKIMGLELASLGFNMNLAPVLDLGNGKSFLENRIWGSDPEVVSELTNSFIDGLHSSRILAVAKHFPGHGGTSVDSHFDLPIIEKSWADYWKTDLLPFRNAVKNGLDAMMSAHVEVRDVSREPASISSKFITQILREKLDFQGLVITDDLEMGGLSQKLGSSVEDLALKSIISGTDIVMVVWSWDIQEKIFERIKKAVLEKQIPESLLDARVAHILKIKKKWLPEMTASEKFENPFWKQNLRTKKALETVFGARREAIRWMTNNQSEVRMYFNSQTRKPWNILMSSESARKLWLKNRPQDKIELMSRRPDNKGLLKIKQFVENSVEKNIPLVVVTQPLASLGNESLSQIIKTMGTAEKSNSVKGGILWVHQGPAPVVLKDSQSLKTGIVSLHSSSLESLQIFMDTNLKYRSVNQVVDKGGS